MKGHHPVSFFFFFNDPATTEIYPLSLHDALPISAKSIGRSRRRHLHRLSASVLWRSRLLRQRRGVVDFHRAARIADRKSTRLNSSHDQISYAVFCLKKKNDDNVTIAKPATLYVHL